MPAPNSPPSANPPEPTRVLSPWSIVSLVLLVLAILFSVLPFFFIQQSSNAGPAEGAALTVVVYGCCIIAFLCVFVGFFTGWFGKRRSRGGMVLAWAGMALHGTILLLLTVGGCLAAVFAAWASFIIRASGG